MTPPRRALLKLLVELGAACADYQDAVLRDLPCRRLQVDEIWTFCYAKEKNVPDKLRAFPLGPGDVWTFVGLCQDTKLVPSWLVGKRDARYAYEFMLDLKSRLRERVQLTTDGHRMYLDAVGAAFGGGIDYAQLIKLYGSDREGEQRYSPARCLGAEKKPIRGKPDLAAVSTSHVERQNLTMRMGMRRFTRLTNGLSKKIANLEAAVALHFMWYNFARPHAALGGRTPAQAAGISRYRWDAEDVATLLDTQERAA